VGGTLSCASCGRGYPLVDGIATLISAEDLDRYQPFLAHYRRVRAAEGWLVDPATWRTLPYPPPDMPHAALWRRRSRSFERLLAVLADRGRGRPLAILDLGAGNCWLTWQLARRGHRVEALDINVDASDGLGAVPEDAAGAFGRTQAALERLPYMAGQLDVVVAAASLHYARDLAAATAEIARILRPGGAMILLDTPLYRTAAAGQAAVARRLADQRLHYGSDGAGTSGSGYIVVWALRHACRRAGLSYREVPLHGRPRALVGRIRRAFGSAWRTTQGAQMPLVIGERLC
jgi:SAM-dependent methyltransferase